MPMLNPHVRDLIRWLLLRANGSTIRKPSEFMTGSLHNLRNDLRYRDRYSYEIFARNFKTEHAGNLQNFILAASSNESQGATFSIDEIVFLGVCTNRFSKKDGLKLLSYYISTYEKAEQVLPRNFLRSKFYKHCATLRYKQARPSGATSNTYPLLWYHINVRLQESVELFRKRLDNWVLHALFKSSSPIYRILNTNDAYMEHVRRYLGEYLYQQERIAA